MDSPAAEAGLKSGDILLQVGRTKVREAEDILDASFFITAGDTVPITVVRDGKELTVNIQAEIHPVSKKLPMSATLESNRSIPLSMPAPQK